MADITPGVAWRWVTSPNHGGKRERTLGIIIHSTRGGAATLESEYQQTVRYCALSAAQGNTAQVGPHAVVGPAEVTLMVPFDQVCWCQTVDNDTHVGIEVAQPTASTPYTDWQYRATADLVARLCLAYDVPPVYLGKQYTEQVMTSGLLGHEDSKAGWSRGKTDPGSRWEWPRFVGLVEDAIDELAPNPWEGVGEGLTAYGRARPWLGTPNRRVKGWHYYDESGDEVVKLAPSGAWLVWRKYTGQIAQVVW